MAETTTIQTTKAARDRLRKLAAERGLTMGELIEELAGATPTAEELEARAQRAKADLETTLGVTVTADDEAAGRALWDRIAAHQGGGQRGAAA
ncbi:hypothetical protein [Streptomyces chiangmaiensis]|uniref:Ribbon-helix-helix protein, CopG family n=1 Tax=Streptomyces chiangmaiensis TaxID=766497 RepID=A0ABU7FY54_9ACTN|nr:hypothetical protein [Streptomyces chiangmaiensis]MED7828844.1 hypothetical protein [Streptomyces chiangmaiensis]